MRVVASIEARMGSSRLPGKVLMPVLGEPALARLIERLRRAQTLDGIVVATTVSGADDPIADLCRRLSIPYYRGSEEDVMLRVAEANRSVEADVVVEITGDCILLSPQVIDEAVRFYLEGSYDVVSNTWELSFPQGVDVQVFSRALLEEALSKTQDPAHREHVSLYFYEHPKMYRIHHLKAPEPFRAPELRFQLDYPEDLAFIRSIYERLYPADSRFDLEAIFALLEREPELKRINAAMQEKPLRPA
jgi:spore coat polysaccharide biosynthesis protein SpsF